MKKSIVFLSLLFCFQVFGSSWFSWRPWRWSAPVTVNDMLSNQNNPSSNSEDADPLAEDTSIQGKIKKHATSAGLTLMGGLAGNNLGEKGGVVSMAGTAAGLYGGYKLGEYVNNSISKEEARKIEARYKKKMGTLNSSISDLQKSLDKALGVSILSQTNLEKLTTEYKTLNTTYESLKTQYETLQDSVNDVSDKVDDSMRLQLGSTLLTIKVALANAESKISQLEGNIEDSEKEKAKNKYREAIEGQTKIIQASNFALEVLKKDRTERKALFPKFRSVSQIMALENGDAGNIRDVSDRDSDLGSEPDIDRYQDID